MDAAAAYHRNAIESTSPVGLVVLLYQNGAVELRRAIAALEAGDIEARTRASNRVLAVIAELKSVLDFERGGSIARQFAQFYQLAERLILDSSCRRDPEPLRQLLEPWSRILEAWQEADARPSPAAGVRPAPGANTAGEVRPAWQA